MLEGEMSFNEMSQLEKYAGERRLLAQEQAELLKQLAKISGELADVQRRHGLLQNSTMSSISCLPNEILATIFEILHHSQTLSGSAQGKRPGLKGEVRLTGSIGRVEVILSRVCSRWRTIAIGLVPLWSVFWCDKPASCKRLIAETKRFRTYLRRSGDFDLRLYFDFTSDTPQGGADDEPEVTVPTDRYGMLAVRLLMLTARHAHRWKHLTIVADDNTKRVPLQNFTREMELASAPRLERMVVCTGPPGIGGKLDGEKGWNPQFLSGSGVGERCPALKYLKLDSAGLAFCRPWIQSLTHLSLEGGDHTNERNLFKIDWPVLLDILRSPHLETLSLCDDVLRKSTFPSSGHNQKEYHLQFASLKHLRLGTLSLKEDRHCFFYFLLRYVTAPYLESLTLAGYSIEESPWGMEATDWGELWGQPNPNKYTFPVLQSLALIDIGLSTSNVSCCAFMHLTWMTSTVHTVVLSCHDAEDKRSLAAVIEQRWPWNERQIPLELVWPNARDITLDFSVAVQDMRRCFQELAMWCMAIPEKWGTVEVLRVPPTWIRLWLSRVKQPLRMSDGYPINFTWADVKEGEAGDGEGEGREKDKSYMIWVNGCPVTVKAIQEVVPRNWPPGSDYATPSNTLESECFNPFTVDVAFTTTTKTETTDD